MLVYHYLELSKILYAGFDLKKERIKQLKKRIDINNEIKLKKQNVFLHKKEFLKIAIYL